MFFRLNSFLFTFFFLALFAQESDPAALKEKAKGFLSIGEDHRYEGNRQEAIKAFSKAIELDPEFVEAYRARGDAKRWEAIEGINLLDLPSKNKQQLRDAMEDYDKAIQLSPKEGVSYNQRAEIKRYLEDFQGALADHGTAIRLEPRNDLFYSSRAQTKDRMKDFDGAIQDITEAIKHSKYKNPEEEKEANGESRVPGSESGSHSGFGGFSNLSNHYNQVG